MSHDLPFGTDTLVIPFTLIRSPAAPRAPGMSRMRPHDTYRMVPPGEDAPAGSAAPIRLPRTPWDPPLSYARQSEADAAMLRLVSNERRNDETERAREELLRDLPEPIPHIRPPPEPHAGFTEPPEVIHIPLLGGGGRASGRGSPPARTVPPTPEPAGAEDDAARQSRTTLRRAMEGAGLLEPGDARQSHHLVPQGGAMNGDRDPEAAQRKLREWGIDINSALNGAPLSRAFHARIHTSKYYEIVLGIARDARSPDEVKRRLEGLRDLLIQADRAFQQSGKFPTWITGDFE